MRVQTDHAETFFPTETTGVAGSGSGTKAVGEAVGEGGNQRQGIGGEEVRGKERDQPSPPEDGGGVSREKYGLHCSLLSIEHILWLVFERLSSKQ